MLIIPAIDLLEGNAVRLSKGKREQVTVYHTDPVQLVAEFIDQGAERIHLVDLNGAFAGARHHSKLIEEICKRSSVPVEVGGGLRTPEAIDECFAHGASFAVLGTAAIKSPASARAACEKYPGKIIVAVDANDGLVAVEGWTETSTLLASELGKTAAGWGAAALLYTDIARDGMATGPNVAATQALAKECEIPVIASGGIDSLDDLVALDLAKIPMAVVGRALYAGHFTLAQGIAALKVT